jgi:ABC-type multidrug transport system fused ATPase/permease subunit
MEKAYKRYEERKKQRMKFLYFLTLFVIIGFVVQSVLVFIGMQFYFYWAIILLVGMLIAFLYEMKQPWGSETLETYIFSNLYQASQQLDLCSSEDSKSKLCLEKASKKLEYVLINLARFEKQLKDVNSGLVKAELTNPISKLRMNLKERILPRIENPKETFQMLAVVNGLADMFGEIQRPLKLEAISEKNNVLERFDKIQMNGQSKKVGLVLSRRPVRFVLSNLFSFFVILGVLLVQSFAAHANFWESLSSTTNFLAFLAIVVALGFGIYEATKKL